MSSPHCMFPIPMLTHTAGHVFKGEGFGHPKDERHCVNSVSVKFDETAQPKKE